MLAIKPYCLLARGGAQTRKKRNLFTAERSCPVYARSLSTVVRSVAPRSRGALWSVVGIDCVHAAPEREPSTPPPAIRVRHAHIVYVQGVDRRAVCERRTVYIRNRIGARCGSPPGETAVALLWLDPSLCACTCGAKYRRSPGRAAGGGGASRIVPHRANPLISRLSSTPSIMIRLSPLRWWCGWLRCGLRMRRRPMG